MLQPCTCGSMNLKYWTVIRPPEGYERDRVYCLDCGKAGPVTHDGGDPMRRGLAVKEAWNEMVSESKYYEVQVKLASGWTPKARLFQSEEEADRYIDSEKRRHEELAAQFTHFPEWKPMRIRPQDPTWRVASGLVKPESTTEKGTEV